MEAIPAADGDDVGLNQESNRSLRKQRKCQVGTESAVVLSRSRDARWVDAGRRLIVGFRRCT